MPSSGWLLPSWVCWVAESNQCLGMQPGLGGAEGSPLGQGCSKSLCVTSSVQPLPMATSRQLLQVLVLLQVIVLLQVLVLVHFCLSQQEREGLWSALPQLTCPLCLREGKKEGSRSSGSALSPPGARGRLTWLKQANLTCWPLLPAHTSRSGHQREDQWNESNSEGN